jgi:hypothetical protein
MAIKNFKKIKKTYVPSTLYNTKSHYGDYVKLTKEYFGEHPSTLAEQYNRKPKKPKKLAKWIVNLMVIASIVIAVVTLSVLCSVFLGGTGGNYSENTNKNIHNFTSLEVAPTFAADKFSTEGYNYRNKPAEFTEYVYNICAENAKNAPFLTAYNKGLLFMKMGNSDNYVDIDSVIMKSQSQYFSIVYHLKNSIPILDTFIGNTIAKTTDVITSERMYATKDASYMAYQKVKNNSYGADGLPSADWTSFINLNATTEHKAVPVFNSSQKGNFEITKQTITANTITDAKVTYNAKDGFYTFTLTLDPDNSETVKNSIADIQTGTGDKNARYTSVTIEFTAWQTGYFRSFDIVEKWSANVLISLNFQLTTGWMFSYADEDCNFTTYKDANDMIKSL